MTQNGNGNGKDKGSALASILNKLDLPTLAVVMLMGGSNLFVTKEDGGATREEARHVIKQVDDMHEALSQFERRQKESLQKATDLLDNQNQILRNQSMMIANQQRLINQLGKPPP